MVKLIGDLPDNVLGLAAKGMVTGADYETTIIPAVEAKLKDHAKLRLLYELGDEFIGFDGEAMWNDTEIGLDHLTAWERIAVVTGSRWLAAAVKAFGFTIPARVRVFQKGEMEAARDWVASS